MATKLLNVRGRTTVEVGEPVAAAIYSYRAGISGGFLAGIVMVMVMAAWGLLTGRGIWFPVNLIAASLLPFLQAASPEELAQSNLLGTIVGTAIHFGICLLLGLLFALLLPTLPGSTFLWGLIVGMVLWGGALYVFLPVINPRMHELVGDGTFLMAHLAFSLVLGWWVTRQPTLAPHD